MSGGDFMGAKIAKNAVFAVVEIVIALIAGE